MIATGMRLQWQPKATRHIQRPASSVQPTTEPTTGSPNKPWKSAAIRFVTSVAAGPITRYPNTTAATMVTRGTKNSLSDRGIQRLHHVSTFDASQTISTMGTTVPA